jgi:hypothetical protein
MEKIMGFDLGKMLGLRRLEKQIRRDLKKLGLHDDLVNIIRKEGELVVRRTLEENGITGIPAEMLIVELKKLA